MPIGALVVSVVAAVLVLIDGAALLAAGSLLQSLGALDLGGVASFLGFLGVLFGVVLLGLAAQLYRDPMTSGWCGIGLIVVSLLALFTGGGFILGSVLGIVGGVLALLFGRAQEEDTYGVGVQPLPPGPGWNCTECRTINPAESWFCGKCGHARPKAGPAGLW